MQIIEILAIITFIVLLGASIFMLLNFYVCDSQNCKAFKIAGNKAPEDTKEYVIALLGELGNDGIWPLPYIGAAILTPLSLWFIGIPITVVNFAILFFVSFVIMYFMFSFYNHHYIKFIARYTAEFIQSDCPSNSINSHWKNRNKTKLPVYEEENEEIKEDIQICQQEIPDEPNYSSDVVDSIEPIESKSPKSIFKSFNDGLNVTFATPVNIF
jgi:hypothetical protein